MSGDTPPPDFSVPAPAPRPPAERALRQAPELREMALIAGLAFFLNIFPGSLLQAFDLRWGLLATQTLFIAAPVLLALRWFYLDPRATLALRSPRPAVWVAVVLGVPGLNHLLTIAGTWQESIVPMPEPMRQFYDALLEYRGPLDFVWLLFTFAVVPAVCEEILFRGFMQAGFIRLLESGPRGVVTTALVFAVFHLDPWRFTGILVLGLFLGALVQRSGSLWPAIGAHALNNILSIAGAALATDDLPAPVLRHALVAAAMSAAALLILLRRPR